MSSIIQDIREKYAKVTVALIALALVGFILTDYFTGKGRAGTGGGSQTVGSVNGTAIDAREFNKTVDNAVANGRQQGYTTEQARDQVWDQKVEEILLSDEYNKLGIEVGKKELNDLLYGPNPSPIAKQYLGGGQGEYNPAQAMQTVRSINSGKDAAAKEQLNQLLNYIAEERQKEKLVNLMANTVNFPRWFVEQQNTDNSLMAKISYVKELYSNVSDSAVKVDDKEIADYISKHAEEKQFKQEESRSISYVAFSASPTPGDSAEAKRQIMTLKAEFDTTTQVNDFLRRNGGSDYFDGYIGASLMQISAKDSIQKLAKNAVYGPYIDGGKYSLAKMIDTKVLPDSVKCRHILISTDVQNGGFEDSVAKAKIDSIKKAVDAGADWGEMVNKYNPQSDGSRATKGEMTFSSSAIQGEGFAKEFGQFILFDGKPGERKVVKTNFGYHYIEIMAYIKPEAHYKVAYLFQNIDASRSTDDSALNAANAFAAECRDLKEFDANFNKELAPKGMKKGVATDIAPATSFVNSIGNSREFVKAIYAAKLGDVLSPVRVGDDYIVAAVTEVDKEGTKSVAKARPLVEPLLRNKKKAELLKQKIGKVSTLEAASAALGGKPIETADSLRISSMVSPTLGREPRIIGAAFNPANKDKVVPEALPGINGVYVVRVDNISSTSAANGSVADQRKSRADQFKQYITYPNSPLNPVTILKNAATIKDNRAKLY